MSDATAEFRGHIYDSFLDTIGATPVVRLAKLAKAENVKAEILGKCEFFNPLSSVKDRIGLAMIEHLEASGELKPGGTLVEPTSGNTGIALAFVAAAKGYRLILTMPESMSIERRKMLRLLGAELELTPAARGMNGAIQRAEQLVKEIPNAMIPQQFSNPANPEIHRETTAEEIFKDCGGKLDYFLSGVGTGGTITGVGEVLKPRIPNLKVIAIEPEDSPVISGGQPGPHKIQGLGAGFIPENLHRDVIDEVLTVSNANAFAMARKAARIEGMPVGISSGAALTAACELGRRPGMEGKRILAILPSFAERYLSTALFEGLE
ncbi:MAG TPA: cysteine synthase A [Dongiaceae bacterium]|jgi:cysteine synthase A|nr:cysteine synthase A [Dongiaceae bacterium]